MRKRKTNRFEVKGNTVTIYTFKNLPFYIDIDDLPKVIKYCWYSDLLGYIKTSINRKPVSLHRFILNPPANMEVDHIDGNKQNNCKSNLRICTHAENCYNIKRRVNPSGVVGVRQKNKTTWNAYISYKNNKYDLGDFESKEQAIKARQEAERKFYGEYSINKSRKEGLLK